MFSECAQPIVHGLDSGNDSGIVTKENTTKGGEEGLCTPHDGQSVGNREKNETHRENSGPHVPGGVSTDAIACGECSSGHDWTESTSVWWKTTCTSGERGWGRMMGAETGGPEKGSIFYRSGTEVSERRSRGRQREIRNSPHTTVHSPESRIGFCFSVLVVSPSSFADSQSSSAFSSSL